MKDRSGKESRARRHQQRNFEPGPDPDDASETRMSPSQRSSLNQLVTCPVSRRLLAEPRALPCGCRVCAACARGVGVGGSGGGGSWRCRCGREATDEAAAAAPVDAERRHLVRLYTQLMSLGSRPDDGGDDGAGMEADGGGQVDDGDGDGDEETAQGAAACLDRRLLGNRMAALERRLDAWERALRDDTATAEAALDAAEAALAGARSRLAADAAAGREALTAARSRVRASTNSSRHQLAEEPPLLPPPPGRLTRWAAGLTRHVTDGLSDASRGFRCRPTEEPPLIDRRSISLAGWHAVAACHVACTSGYHSEAGGRVFEAAASAAGSAEGFQRVGARPLPPDCVAVLLLPRRRQKSEEDTAVGKILLLAAADEHHGTATTEPTPTASLAGSSGGDDDDFDGRRRELPLRLAGCPTEPRLFLLTLQLLLQRRRRRRQRRLLVSQCGLDGRPEQSVELLDFRHTDNAGGDGRANGRSEVDEAEEAKDEDDSPTDGDGNEGAVAFAADLRIESDAKLVVVFSGGGCRGGSGGGRLSRPLVILLDRASLRVVQRLRLPEEAAVLHATPSLIWMRHVGRLKLVSQASRQVGRDWPEPDGRLFYATDAAEIGDSSRRGGLAVATENCVRLFDRDLQPIGVIGGSRRHLLRHPVAVCCLLGSSAAPTKPRRLAVCDALAEELLLFALE